MTENQNTTSQTRDWKASVFSDGTSRFLSNPNPGLREEVKVRIRFYKDSPVQKVFIKLFKNGEQLFLDAHYAFEDAVFSWYEASFLMTQPRMSYQFMLATEDRVYYYSQAGLATNFTDLKHDFVVLTDYKQPEWVKNAVFYQIFPERFCNGDPSLNVKDGEYQVNGYDTIAIKDWNTPAGTYDQVHCADFYGGDLIGIRQKIPYLKELGVTALYLNPIFQAPSVHKYDCIDYLHVDDHFGGDQALADLSKALHENGMKLILDISINHTGTAHKWFNKDLLYFDKKVGAYYNPENPERSYYTIREDGSYECWAGVPELPKLDYTSEPLRDALYRAEDSVIKKWLKPPYSIDGWRFDVADVMANQDEKQLAGQVWPELCAHIRSVNPEAYILAEHWDDCTDFLQGDCWDATMNYYAYGRIIRQFYGAPDSFTERNPAIWPLTCQISAEDFRYRIESYLSRLPFVMWQNQYNLFDSHDIGRFHIYPGMNDRKYRGAVIAQFTMVGTPSIYYGDEAGIGGMVGFFEGGRYPMPWDSGFEEKEIYKLHKKLAHLRKEHAALVDGSFCFVLAENNVITYARFDEKELILTILSGSEEARNVELDLRPFGLIGDSVMEDLLEEKEYPLSQGRLTLTLEGQESCLLKGTLV